MSDLISVLELRRVQAQCFTAYGERNVADLISVIELRSGWPSIDLLHLIVLFCPPHINF